MGLPSLLGLQWNEIISEYLSKEDFSSDELNSIEDESISEDILNAKEFLSYFYSIDISIDYLIEGKEYFEEQSKYHYNINFNGRKSSDDIYDINDINYGDYKVNNIKPTETHGTHVAGIIAGLRNNSIGNNGINNHVKIMALRAVPNGDEYDKDIARAKVYAVDNGAKIINGSFGKYYSSNPEWVIDAIRYASEKDVLIVHASGNESKDLDKNENDNYPNDQFFENNEFSDTFINVGASSINYDKNIKASFSNYGKSNVDIFAPGVRIYSTMPDNKYDFLSGTSMAAPSTSGVASLIFSYFPKLSAKKVKEIIIESGISIDLQIENIDEDSKVPFKNLSKSGKIVNAYNALIMASKSRKK